MNTALSDKPYPNRIMRLVLTPGEPAGIGPDLCVQLAQQPPHAQLIAIADPQLLADRAALLGLPLQLREFSATAPPHRSEPGELFIAPVPLSRAVTPGQLDPGNADYVLQTLRRAVEGCLQGEFDALVTGPVHKGVINEAGGIPFSGHTEFLAGLTGTRRVVMMLATPGLRVALATTHLPLAEVSRNITPQRLEEVIRILHHEMGQRFGLATPRIMVCGLNPHAGEGGHLGREEVEVIAPLLERLRSEGMHLFGPLPADTLFTPRYLDEADAVLAMYHDQGLPVLKHMGFGRAVNITLGLPLIRTSVDHGTALELAGSGQADTGSLNYAIEVAIDMATGKHA